MRYHSLSSSMSVTHCPHNLIIFEKQVKFAVYQKNQWHHFSKTSLSRVCNTSLVLNIYCRVWVGNGEGQTPSSVGWMQATGPADVCLN